MDLTFDGYDWRRTLAIDSARNYLHAQVSRNSLLWDQIEPAQGVRDWSRTDSVVSELAAANIEPLFVLYGSPSWANGNSDRNYVPPEGPAFDQWLAEYADFVEAAVERYKGTVKMWEVWNEENEHYFWKPAPNIDLYARFYTTVRNAILSADPTAKVSVGGLAGIAASGPIDTNGLAFLRDLVSRHIPIDYVALHPYAGQQQGPDDHIRWENNFTDIQLVRDYLESAGEAVPIWVTEWGWSSNDVGEATQAAYTAESLQMIKNRYPFVSVATIFIDRDRPPEYHQGLFDSQFNPKPAAQAMADFMLSLPTG